MSSHKIKRGLNLPIKGKPEGALDSTKGCRRVAIVAEDYVGMKPTFFVKAGDTVKRGQPLFEDKKTPGVVYTSPAAGTLVGIHRGERRALQSVLIDLNENEMNSSLGEDDSVAFASFSGKKEGDLGGDDIRALLLESGLWTALRTRPYSKVPSPETTPHSLFINAMDSHPLAPSIEVITAGREDDLSAGITALAKLTQGKTFFCKAPESKLNPPANSGVSVEEFSGPHPSGIVGTHIHFLDAVSSKKVVWHIGLQDVIAVGALVRTGKLDVTRIVSLAGSGVKKPRHLRTRIGVSIDELVENELEADEQRVISGSVLSGRQAAGPVNGFLGRYHQQISVIAEDRKRRFLGWMSPGFETFSVVNLFLSKLNPLKQFNFTTTMNGSKRAMVPIGTYEKVMPLDILPSFLLRSLIVKDIEEAEKLGCLELDEEDLSLCTFVCPGKYDYGPILRTNLTIIEKEG